MNRDQDQFEETVKLISFYLPQFHPIPENDAWWGKGFTEWRNVVQAKPLFKGHYQPHIPADLGFYDLRLPDVQLAQAELARQHGIHGFCYYHYWFNGQRLLETPFNQVFRTGSPDFPFCLCWANENWTRRWDGLDSDILMEQDYNFDDDRNHIRSLLAAFEDRRYIRVGGRPLFLVYRIELFPDPTATSAIWREEAIKAGIGEIYLANVHSLGNYANPTEYGFDASVEFAPDWYRTGPNLNHRSLRAFWKILTSGVTRNTRIFHYDEMVRRMLLKDQPDYQLFRCVTPSWDKTARRQHHADVFLGSSPEKYQQWLSEVIKQTTKRNQGDERIVFINAWNEWAEGCHLEPDLKYGHAWLEATARALENS